MRILHINCTDIGSTGKIISCISKEMANENAESFLLAPKKQVDDENIQILPVCWLHEQGVNRRISRYLGFQYGFAPRSTHKIIQYLKKIKPDLVHLHSINCNMVNIYYLLDYLKKAGMPTVITNHAEFFYTGSCSHAYDCMKWKEGCGECPNCRFATQAVRDTSAAAWEKMKKAFADAERMHIVSVSPWQFSRSKESPIIRDISQSCIYNGIETSLFKLREETPNGTDKKTDPRREKIVLAVTAYFDPLDRDVKGGFYFIELAKKFQKDHVKFLIAGPCAKSEVQLPDNVTVLGEIRNQEKLVSYYNRADVVVTLSKRETFGMSVAESLCCGTPIVGFKNGGSESIALDQYSYFCDFADIESLEEQLRSKWLDAKGKYGSNTIANAAKEVYSGERMAKEYRKLYKEVLVNE